MNSTLKILSTIAFSLAIMSSPLDSKAADVKGMGVPEEPHGYPAWFSDSNGLKLELCIDPEPDPLLNRCANDPVEAGNAWSELTGFGAEAFWLLAGAAIDEDTVPAPSNGLVEAELTLALEAAYGADESIVDGNQVSFGRVRVRMDVDTAGTYRITHPYGQIVFENVGTGDVRDVNYTADIGAANPLAVAVAFGGTLNSAIMSPVGSILPPPDMTTTFITSPEFAADPNAFLVNGKQYIAGTAPTTIVGSPTGNNFFRVERQTGPDTWVTVGETTLFDLVGRVYDGHEITEKTTFGNIPTQNLAAVGPVNRATPFFAGSTANITGTLAEGYPIGYPLWYQDQSGLKLTITFPPMGISDPIDDGGDYPLNTAGETFYWSAGANFDAVPAAAALNPLVEFAMEGTFGGDESVVDGFQMTFARMRIRIDTPTAGTYTVTHPYGSNTFEVDAAALADGINYTQDIGSSDLTDPDSVFNGALYGIVGPNFLTWDTFNPNPTLNDPLLQKDNPANPAGPKLQYVGDPAIPHAIKGGANGNIVTIQGPGINVQTALFDVTGQVFFERNNGALPAVNLLLLEE